LLYLLRTRVREKMRPTIKDIAKKAGVSHTTVSRALNGNQTISPETVARIQGIAKELGYLGSATARGLKTNRSQVIGVLVSRIDNPYFGEIIQGIEETINNRGYSLVIASSHRDPSKEKMIIHAFARQMVDGVIICTSSFSEENAAVISQYEIPCVVVNNETPEKYDQSLQHDDLSAGSLIARYLLQMGHRRLAYIGDSLAVRINNERQQGFIDELNRNEKNIEPQIIIHSQGRDIENGEEAMIRLLRVKPHPTAVFCFNDLMAIGAIKTIKDHRLRVPEDISVVGFDNIPFSAYISPALTTFDQPKFRMGQESAELLLHEFESPHKYNPNFIRHKNILGKLLVRESASAPLKRISS
jgi:DNA-binding LacI/PurR family transcriptional regulator